MSNPAQNRDLVCADCGIAHPSTFCPLSYRDQHRMSFVDSLISFAVVGIMLLAGTVGSYLFFDAIL